MRITAFAEFAAQLDSVSGARWRGKGRGLNRRPLPSALPSPALRRPDPARVFQSLRQEQSPVPTSRRV